MKIAIAGSTGFIGKQLSDYLLQSGNELIAISRGDFAAGINQLAKVINSADVIINLAGASVLQRWNDKNMQRILSSRVDTTRLLVDAVLAILPENRPSVFINASAIGIYSNGAIHDERSSDFGTDFLATVCKAWEHETVPLAEVDLRLITIRIGIALGTTGGSFQKMMPIFKWGLGGKIGTGDQPFSFIHIVDFCRAINHLITNDKCAGIYNLVAPEPITNKIFTATLSGFLHRPAFFTVPEFALRIVYGKAAEMLTNGAFVLPSHLIEEGFQFQFPDVSSAISNLVNEK